MAVIPAHQVCILASENIAYQRRELRIEILLNPEQFKRPFSELIYQILKKLVRRVRIYNVQFQQVHQACKAWGVAQFISEIKANIGIYIKKELVKIGRASCRERRKETGGASKTKRKTRSYR